MKQIIKKWIYITAITITMIFTFGCNKEAKQPKVTTVAATGITSATVITGGIVTSEGKSSITAKGVCWAKSQNPTMSGYKTIDGIGPGEYKSSITGLTPNTLYYYRAYATNKAGTSYGEQLTFTTLN